MHIVSHPGAGARGGRAALADVARKTAEERKTSAEPARLFTAANLAGGARIDAVLGNFVLTEDLFYNYRRVQIDIVKARNSAAVDTYLLKWENHTRNDPFGMEGPYRQNKTLRQILLRYFKRNRSSWQPSIATA